MTKKDFFRIIIKLFGLYWLINIMYSIVQLFSFYVNMNSGLVSWLYLIGTMIILFSIFLLLIVGADKIIIWLKLDKGFDDDRIDFQNFDIGKILMFSFIIIGATMILDNIASFLNQTYLFLEFMFSGQKDIIVVSGQSNYQLIVSFTKIIVGCILLTNYPAISKYVLKITQKKEEIQ